MRPPRFWILGFCVAAVCLTIVAGCNSPPDFSRVTAPLGLSEVPPQWEPDVDSTQR